MRAGTILDSLGFPSSPSYCTVKRPFVAAVTVPTRHRSLLRMSRDDVSGELPRLSTYTYFCVVFRKGAGGVANLFDSWKSSTYLGNLLEGVFSAVHPYLLRHQVTTPLVVAYSKKFSVYSLPILTEITHSSQAAV